MPPCCSSSRSSPACSPCGRRTGPTAPRVAADARRVGAQALLVEDLDHSLLLAVEGVRLDDSTDTRANLLAALSRSPELIASTRGDGSGFISVELSPDGTVVGVGEAFSGLSFYDTSTRELLGTYDE